MRISDWSSDVCSSDLYLGLDRDMRDQFRDSPYYAACAEFCEKYDAPAFDPDYDSEPQEFFEPMVMRLCFSPRTCIYKKVRVEEAAEPIITAPPRRLVPPTACTQAAMGSPPPGGASSDTR